MHRELDTQGTFQYGDQLSCMSYFCTLFIQGSSLVYVYKGHLFESRVLHLFLPGFQYINESRVPFCCLLMQSSLYLKHIAKDMQNGF